MGYEGHDRGLPVSLAVVLTAALAAALLMASTTFVIILVSCGARPAATGSSHESYSSNRNGKIAFVGPGGLSVVYPDGGGSSKLATKPVEDDFPAWSPDGKRLAFEAANPPSGLESAYPLSRDPNAPLYSLDFYLINADGSGLRHVTTDPKTHHFSKVMDDRMPSFSPDGTRVVYVGRERSGGADLYVMNADGTNVRKLAQTHGGYEPDWQPLP